MFFKTKKRVSTQGTCTLIKQPC